MEHLVTIAHDNAIMNTQQEQERIDSYDGCSTENKSPSLNPRSCNQSPTIRHTNINNNNNPLKVQSQRSDSKVLSMVPCRGQTHKNYH